MKSEDVLILLKLAASGGEPWTVDFLAAETGHDVTEIQNSLEKLRNSNFLTPDNKIRINELQNFILFGIHQMFPASPGRIVSGVSTGAKPNQFFTAHLPYTSITVWPCEFGKEQGFEIRPLSPHCCFAALNDSRLRRLLAITETMRIVGAEAGFWAASELSSFLG